MNTTASSPLTDAPERIAQLIWVLCQTVTERCGVRVRALTREQVEYIVKRLLAARARFRDVVERVRAGHRPKLRARKPRARRLKPKRVTFAELAREFGSVLPRGWRRRAREDRARERAMRKAAREAAAAVGKKPMPLWRGLRQHVRAWLCPLVGQIPEFRNSAPAHANHLRQILGEPEMQALLLSHPSVGEALREVCHALGVERSLLHLSPLIPAAPVMEAHVPAAPASPLGSTEKVVARPPAAAAPVAAGQTDVSRAAAQPPPPTAQRAMPSARGSPATGVVILDYWDLR